MLQPLSGEQERILDAVKTGKNVVVNAVAGTGKTTMILSIAGDRELKHNQILQLTYNSSLKTDVRERVHQTGLTNLQIHSYHSLMRAYYLDEGYTDSDMRRLIQNKDKVKRAIPPFNILVIDEAQDMSFLYFQFVVRFLEDLKTPVQLIILGDYAQGLYDFKGSDTRFLTAAELIWAKNPHLKTDQFIHCEMKMSFRITNQMCLFINEVMLGQERMRACRDGPKVTYLRNTAMNLTRMVYGEIIKLFEQGATPSDIFVLAGSVKGKNSRIRNLENALVERGIPCHVPIHEGGMDERIIQNKVVFSTFHTVKGRQRKYVFIVEFDNAYLSRSKRGGNHLECPNTLYVAATRATEGLYLLEHNDWSTDRPLKFLKKGHVEMKQQEYIEFKGQHQTLFRELRNSMPYTRTTPTELIKFIDDSVLDEISILLEPLFINKNTKHMDETIDIPSVIETGTGLFEEVSDINGIAIPCIFYDHLRKESKKSILYDIIDTNIEMLGPQRNTHNFLESMIDSLPDEITTVKDYLFITNIAIASQEQLYFRLKQIDHYDWLTDKMVYQCLKRLKTVLGTIADPLIEEYILVSTDDKAHEPINQFIKEHVVEATVPIRFTARVDLITDSVWELKCTSEITMEHKLQVVIYAWLWRMTRTSNDDLDKEFKLFNIKTNMLLELSATMDQLNQIMVLLLHAKYATKRIKTDEEFVQECTECFLL